MRLRVRAKVSARLRSMACDAYTRPSVAKHAHMYVSHECSVCMFMIERRIVWAHSFLGICSVNHKKKIPRYAMHSPVHALHVHFRLRKLTFGFGHRLVPNIDVHAVRIAGPRDIRVNDRHA